MNENKRPHLGRREFVGTGLLGVTAVYLGCGTEYDEGAAPSDELTDPLDTATAGPLDPVDPVLEPTCGEVTEPNIEGPFYTPASPERRDLVDADVTGVSLIVSGTVLSHKCEPLPDALLDFWQCNDAGDYDNVGFTLRGHQFTDSDGRFELRTILPGHYPNGGTFRPAHIHVKASAAGTGLLTTQLYFADDPYNDTDAFIRDSLIMPVTAAADGSLRCAFDFVLQTSI